MEIVTGTSGEQENEPVDAIGGYFLLMDPDWESDSEEQLPPLEAIVGLWPLDDDGRVGRFLGNPDHRPRDENSASDPIDALLRLVARGDAAMEQLQLLFRECRFGIAMDEDAKPMMTMSADGKPCVVMATGAPHQQRVTAAHWQDMDLEELDSILLDGVDVLVNPDGPASTRLACGFIRGTARMTDDELAAAYETFNPSDELDDLDLDDDLDDEDLDDEDLGEDLGEDSADLPADAEHRSES